MDPLVIDGFGVYMLFYNVTPTGSVAVSVFAHCTGILNRCRLNFLVHLRHK